MGPNPFDPSNLRSPAGAAWYFTFVDPDKGSSGRSGGGGQNGCGCAPMMIVVAILIGIAIAALTNT